MMKNYGRREEKKEVRFISDGNSDSHRFSSVSKVSSMTKIVEAFMLSVLAIFIYSCATEKEVSENKFFSPPEKIVLGGEATGKIALVKDGEISKIAEIPGAVLHQVIFSHDGRYIFAASQNQNVVYVLDGENLQVIKEISVGEHPSHMSFDDSGRILSVVNEDSGEVSFISTYDLVEIKRVKGFSTPHFARYYNGLWYVANLSANKISVVDYEKGEIISEIEIENTPPCQKDEECAFFDISVREGIGVASHIKTGKIVIFNPNTLKVERIIDESNPSISRAYSRFDVKDAFRTIISPFDPVFWTAFRGGVISYDFVAGHIRFVWESEKPLFSQFVIEYPGKAFVLEHKAQKVLIFSKYGYLEKEIKVNGIPGEGLYYNGFVYIFVIGDNLSEIVAIDGKGNTIKIAEFDFSPAEGIHIPKAYPYCH